MTEQRTMIVGHVRPSLRHGGIGTYLTRWSQAQAQSLLAQTTKNQPLMQVVTASLTDSADRLYRAHGFEQATESRVMRRDHHQPLPDHPLPQGVTITTRQPDVAEQFYQAYHAAFRERPDFPGWSAAEWIGRMTENDHRPEWSRLARAGGVPVGFVIGNIDLTASPPGGFVRQIGVVPDQRRRGLGSALMADRLPRMHGAGAPWADLTVHIDNPGAIQAYTQLGFLTIGRRARCQRLPNNKR